jgi:Leucine-rich repeat (LRR) protein
MYLSSSSKSYKKKYRKYKNKYKILKSHIDGTLLNGCTQGTLLNGGDCDPLPNLEEEDLFTTHNLLDLCPEERITIQNKCYEVISLYKWIVEGNHDILPLTQTFITSEERQELIQAYKVLSRILALNILTREKIIQLYPDLQHRTSLYLPDNGYTNIAPGTFDRADSDDNLLHVEYLYLDNNEIQELHSSTFNNLPLLKKIFLHNNQIKELEPNIFNNLPSLCALHLQDNQIQELQPGIFNNLSRLQKLNLYENQINTIQPGVFNNLLNLTKLKLYDNHPRCL